MAPLPNCASVSLPNLRKSYNYSLRSHPFCIYHWSHWSLLIFITIRQSYLLPSSKTFGLEFKLFKVCSNFATDLLDNLGRSQPLQCNFLFCRVMPIAWQHVAQELQTQVSASELLKENTLEMQFIIAVESGNMLHLLLWAKRCRVYFSQVLCISTDMITTSRFDLLMTVYNGCSWVSLMSVY